MTRMCVAYVGELPAGAGGAPPESPPGLPQLVSILAPVLSLSAFIASRVAFRDHSHHTHHSSKPMTPQRHTAPSITQ